MSFRLFNKEDENVKKYVDRFDKYVNSLNEADKDDNNKINELFAEITMLNIKLERRDNRFSNIIENIKKNKSENKKTFIRYQFEDVLNFSKRKYDENDYICINNVMNKVLPENERGFWQNIWLIIREGFDKAAGRRK